MYSDNDDEDFGNPSSSSNLANLFGGNFEPTQKLNQSLRYVAPPQPKPEDKTKSSSKLICAKPVTLSKLVEGKYVPVGKYGLALIDSGTACELIAYKTQQNIMMRMKVHEKFTVVWKGGNCAEFLDDQKQNWLAKFEDNDSSAAVMTAFESCGGKVERAATGNQEGFEKKAARSQVALEKEIKLPVLASEIDNQSDSSSSQTRARILSRMAKMGQEILPKAARESVSDSDTDTAFISKKPTRKTKRNSSLLEREAVESVANYKPQLAPVASSRLVPMNSQIVANNAEVLAPYDHLNLLFSENRMQNNEIKLNISHMSLQLEKLLHEMRSKSATNCEDEDRLRAKVKALELKTENLSRELERSKRQMEECTTLRQTIEEQQKIICEQQARIESLNEQNSIELEEHRKQAAADELTIKELRSKVENQQLKLIDFEGFYNENKNNKNLLKTVDELNAQVANLKLKLKDFEDYHKQKELEKSELDRLMNDMVSDFIDKMKTTMNMMFHNVIESFKSDDDNAQFQGTFIASVLAQNIKTTTYEIIQEFQKDFRVDRLSNVLQNGTESKNFSRDSLKIN